jgi:hypothetical protein
LPRLAAAVCVALCQQLCAPDLKICTAPLEELERYALEVIRRVALLGVKVLVFGSGKAREGRRRCRWRRAARFEEFTALCAR